MKKLHFCKKCKKYTLKKICPQCKLKTISAGYKFIQYKKENGRVL